MAAILLRAFGFLLIIALGQWLKLGGMAKRDDAKLLSAILMNITLPCVILSSVTQLDFSLSLIFPFAIGLGANFATAALGYYRTRGQSLLDRAQAVVQNSGYNIGNFALPFAQSFFPLPAILTILLFDTGNSIMVLRGNYLLGRQVLKTGQSSFWATTKSLFLSVPLLTYLLTLLLSLLHLQIPQPILDITSIAANANPFIAMLMVGLLVDLKLGRQELRQLWALLGQRLGISVLLALVIFFFLPLALEVKQVLIFCLFTPIAGLSPVHCLNLGIKSPLPANLNSLSIIVALPIMTLLMIFFT